MGTLPLLACFSCIGFPVLSYIGVPMWLSIRWTWPLPDFTQILVKFRAAEEGGPQQGLDGPASLKPHKAAPAGDVLLWYGVPLPRWSIDFIGVVAAWNDGECWLITVCPHSRAPAFIWGAGKLGGSRRLSCMHWQRGSQDSAILRPCRRAAPPILPGSSVW